MWLVILSWFAHFPLVQEEVLTVFGLVALSPEELCAGYLNKCGSEYDPFHQRWNVTIPGNKPSVAAVPSPMVTTASFTRQFQLTSGCIPEY